MRKTKIISLVVLGVLLGIVAVIFVLTNKQPMTLSFLYFETVPLWSSLIVLASMALGAALSFTYCLVMAFGYRRRIKLLNRQIKQMEDELLTFRHQPLQDLSSLPTFGDTSSDDSASR